MNSLSSLNLDAFKQVALEKNFSLAAKKLSVTQSALSQRIINLEQEIGTSLFIRESKGVLLTETGQRLLRYCQEKHSLEQEFWGELKQSGQLSGIIRLATFSSVAKSIVLPLLAPLIKQNPHVQLDMKVKEMRQLHSTLMSGEVDYIITTDPLEKHGVENHLLGHETNVLITSTLKKAVPDVYLDHDEHDSTTYDYLVLQGEKVCTLKRSYLDDIETIVEGVRLGLGQAVVPLHLIENVKGIEVVKAQKSMKIPIYLTQYCQSFPTRLQKEARNLILHKFGDLL